MRVHQANRGRDGEKAFRYSIRKYHFGAASVAVAALLFLGNGSVSAQSPSLSTDQSREQNQQLDRQSGIPLEKPVEQGEGKGPATTPASTPALAGEGVARKQVDKTASQAILAKLEELMEKLPLQSRTNIQERFTQGIAAAKIVLTDPAASQEQMDKQKEQLQQLQAELESLLRAQAGGLESSQLQLAEAGPSLPSRSRVRRDIAGDGSNVAQTSSLKVGKVRPNGQYYPNADSTIYDRHIQGKTIRFKAESQGKKIRDFSITGLEGYGLELKKSNLGESTAYAWLEGTIPAHHFGSRTYRITVTDTSGHTEIQEGVITVPAPKARFVTTNEQVKGKAGEIPQDPNHLDSTKYIQARLPGPVDERNIKRGEQVKVYLVRGGRNREDYSVTVPHAEGYREIASGQPDSNGIVTFTPDSFHRYGVSSLGTEPLRLVVKIVRSGTDTPNDPEGGVSLLSDDSIRATVNKSGLTAAKSSLEQDLAQEANTSGKTEASKQAYEAAKSKAREAINKAKEIEAKQDATEAEVQEAEEKLTEAKQGLSTAKNNLVDVNKGDQGNGQSGDQGGSASGGQTAPNTQAKSTT